jgi:DNA polymerase-4
VHVKLKQILSAYTDKLTPKSVDEFVLDLHNTPASKRGMEITAGEIKQRIKQELGDYLTVSIGIAPNRVLAKLAAGLHKPDGLDVIDAANYLDIYQRIDLTDLPGINVGYKARLSRAGIYSVIDLLNNSIFDLHQSFKSVVGNDWFARIRGWEVDEVDFGRKSFSNTHSIKIAVIHENDIFPIMTHLIWKATSRMRLAGFFCYGVQLGFRYRNGQYALDHIRSPHPLFSSVDIFSQLKKLFYRLPRDYVSKVDVGVYDLCSGAELQLSCLDNTEKLSSLYRAIDAIEQAWGRNTIHPARMLPAKDLVLNRLPFGGGKEMEQYVFNGEEL